MGQLRMSLPAEMRNSRPRRSRSMGMTFGDPILAVSPNATRKALLGTLIRDEAGAESRAGRS